MFQRGLTQSCSYQRFPGQDVSTEIRNFEMSLSGSNIYEDSPFTSNYVSRPIVDAGISDSSEDQYDTALEKMSELHVDIHQLESRLPSTQVRYLGKSSTAMLTIQAMELKRLSYLRNGTGVPPTFGRRFRPEVWARNYTQWNVGESWHRGTLMFPPDDIMTRLVDAYFEEMNIYFPVLHRQTFDRLLTIEKLHLRDEAFAVTVLLVCAIGARRLETALGDEEGAFRGWIWFNQARDYRVGYMALPTLHDLQSRAVCPLTPTCPERSYLCLFSL